MENRSKDSLGCASAAHMLDFNTKVGTDQHTPLKACPGVGAEAGVNRQTRGVLVRSRGEVPYREGLTNSASATGGQRENHKGPRSPSGVCWLRGMLARAPHLVLGPGLTSLASPAVLWEDSQAWPAGDGETRAWQRLGAGSSSSKCAGESVGHRAAGSQPLPASHRLCKGFGALRA